jgi:hypothetical protein
MFKGIEIRSNKRNISTSGLMGLIGREIELPREEREEQEYVSVCKYLIDYIVSEKPVIKPDQTISFKSWVLKFIAEDDSKLVMYEADVQTGDYRRGVDHAIKAAQEQESMCRLHNAAPHFPTLNQKIVISEGVYEGLPLEGVRYPSPAHMSGWWLSTDLYNGDIKSLLIVHAYHVYAKRKDIVKYLALPFGFRFFYSQEGQDVWLDDKIK